MRRTSSSLFISHRSNSQKHQTLPSIIPYFLSHNFNFIDAQYDEYPCIFVYLYKYCIGSSVRLGWFENEYIIINYQQHGFRPWYFLLNHVLIFLYFLISITIFLFLKTPCYPPHFSRIIWLEQANIQLFLKRFLAQKYFLVQYRQLFCFPVSTGVFSWSSMSTSKLLLSPVITMYFLRIDFKFFFLHFLWLSL